MEIQNVKNKSDRAMKEELKLMQNLVSFDSEINEENLVYLKDCLSDPFASGHFSHAYSFNSCFLHSDF